MHPIQILLYEFENKVTIFKHVSNLKDTYFSIDEQMPARLRELKYRNRQLYAENEARTTGKLAMSFEKGKLKVKDKEFQGQMKIPSLREIIKPSTQDQAIRLGTKIHKGNAVNTEGSRFTGYMATVESLKQVNQLYAQVQRENSDARHVMCAFRLPHEDYHIYENYQDDGEHAGGKMLLQALKHSKIYNRAVFVVRHYDGRHIGPKRFDSILDAAKSAFTIHPFNELTKENEYLWIGDIGTPGVKYKFQSFRGRGKFSGR